MVIRKDLGQFYEIDEAGYIVNPSRIENIKPPWDKLVSAIKSAYLKKYAGHLHSIYLRGSLAHGQAMEGVSDADSFAVLKPGSENAGDLKGEIAIATQLQAAFPFTAGVEFFTLPFAEMEDARGLFRFIIKVESACLFGQDLSAQTPPFKVNQEISFQARRFSQHLDQFTASFPSAQDASKREKHCSWIMKRIVRGGFELVMVAENKFTRDLYPCYATFAKHYPEQEPQMRQALEWAVEPVSDVAAVMSLIADLGQWLRQEIKTSLLGSSA